MLPNIVSVAYEKVETGMNSAGLALILLMAAGFTQTAIADGSTLSPAEKAIIAKRIAALPSPEERHLAQEWSEAKSVAEFLCRPAAMSVLRRQVKGADRVFLGSDAADSLKLESSGRLTGTGSVRSPSGWRDFTFQCQINQKNGRATKFRASLKP
jgi:hypothetical protein